MARYRHRCPFCDDPYLHLGGPTREVADAMLKAHVAKLHGKLIEVMSATADAIREADDELWSACPLCGLRFVADAADFLQAQLYWHAWAKHPRAQAGDFDLDNTILPSGEMRVQGPEHAPDAMAGFFERHRVREPGGDLRHPADRPPADVLGDMPAYAERFRNGAGGGSSSTPLADPLGLLDAMLAVGQDAWDASSAKYGVDPYDQPLDPHAFDDDDDDRDGGLTFTVDD